MLADLDQPIQDGITGCLQRISHYFYTSLSRQFDAVIHIDETRAVRPLERTAQHHAGEASETYPTGI